MANLHIDLTGQCFGKLTVLALVLRRPTKWRCRCACGTELDVWGTHLRRGNTRSCGCGRRKARSAEPPPVVPGAVWIALAGEGFTLVDAADVALAARWSWHRDSGGYARGGGGRLHKLLLPNAVQVDHVNGDRLDNRRANLRAATHTENSRNRRPSSACSYKGVTWCQGAWMAQLTHGGKNHYGGRFATPEEAARAHDRLARKLHGAFARLNFPGEGA